MAASTGRGSRHKGKSAELEVVHLARAAGFSDAQRTGSAGQIRGDIDGIPGVYVEVRRRETLALPAWCREAEEEAPDLTLPVVAFRRSHEPWRAALPLAALLELLADRGGY